ncbi:sugar transferase [Streptococcus thermophilus]|uniref:sugar transferase n=1 Tax=Streptococcus thermophilus TaxID=1308 RepID=UPI000B361A9E
MSLVGPRPPLPREVAQYMDYQKQRLQVRPGCTGLWQVSKRNNCTFLEMVELDLKYVREQNFLYDISLIFRTVWVMIRPNGES